MSMPSGGSPTKRRERALNAADADLGSTASSLAQQLRQLPSLARKDLIQRFRLLYERDPPLRLSDKILRLAIAYRMQEKVYGGLKPDVARALQTGPSGACAQPGDGSVLVREWAGRQYVVRVLGQGYEYEGQKVGSLTEVAFRITGQKRSGPAFFGLTGKGSGR